MSMYDETSVKITKLSGGYLLEWHRPSSRNATWGTAFPEPETSGRELFPDLKKTLDRAKAIL